MTSEAFCFKYGRPLQVADVPLWTHHREEHKINIHTKSWEKKSQTIQIDIQTDTQRETIGWYLICRDMANLYYSVKNKKSKWVKSTPATLQASLTLHMQNILYEEEANSKDARFRIFYFLTKQFSSKLNYSGFWPAWAWRLHKVTFSNLIWALSAYLLLCVAVINTTRG